jgi:hypothetical protein
VQEHGFLDRAYDAPIDCFVITSASLAFYLATASGDNRISAFVERAGPGDYRPSRSSDLRRERDCDLVDMHSALQTVEPSAQAVTRSIEVRYTRARPVDQQSSDVAVAAFADSEKLGFAGPSSTPLAQGLAMRRDPERV